MSFVVAEKEAQAKVLLKKMWETPFYFSVILVRSDSRLKTLKDLGSAKVAFVDQKSTSGYLYPSVELKRNKIVLKPEQIQFSGSHSNSVSLLEQKKVDAIAVFSDDEKALKSAFQKYQMTKTKVRRLWVSEPIPNDPFAVRADFYTTYPDQVHQMMAAVIDTAEKLKEDVSFVDFLGAKGFMPATTRQYQPVREMVQELGIK
jgi:phosphonate transport system substrate-binding protein